MFATLQVKMPREINPPRGWKSTKTGFWSKKLKSKTHKCLSKEAINTWESLKVLKNNAETLPKIILSRGDWSKYGWYPVKGKNFWKQNKVNAAVSLFQNAYSVMFKVKYKDRWIFTSKKNVIRWYPKKVLNAAFVTKVIEICPQNLVIKYLTKSSDVLSCLPLLAKMLDSSVGARILANQF
jgi:hypothetical protein